MKTIELLSPAKNLEFGREAINHGADAIYVGAPAFGARASAGNSVGDIESLTKYAHRYGARVYVTLNTSLFDDELEPASKLIRQFYDIGTDAVIIQDLGLLETDLPPIALHASTQTNNASPERIKFLEKVGFRRVILARELSLEQIAEIRRETSVELECFVQGALCVSYSGQCYMSQSINGRSGNRGVCSQPCRSSYNLYNAENKQLVHKRHLLSLKDFNASEHLQEYIDMGISSLKIEGRLKDICYVKNITAYYRNLLDGIMAGNGSLKKSSSGKCVFSFQPDPERTFNRGFTDYFLKERQPMASMNTQKSIGKKTGTVLRIEKNCLVCRTLFPITAGDGLCFMNSHGTWEGFLVNKTEGNKLYPNNLPDSITAGAELFRNNDIAFEKEVSNGKSAQRKVDVNLVFAETGDGFMLSATDEDGISASATLSCEKQEARNPDKSAEQIGTQLQKTGDTVFSVHTFENLCGGAFFIPASQLNELRRRCLEELTVLREKHFSPADSVFEKNDFPYFEKSVDYRANILNDKSLQFYKRHGAEPLEPGVEKSGEYAGKALMTTKYCIRYELGQCIKRHEVSPEFRSDLYLENNGRRYLLKFDCKKCQMQIFLNGNHN